MQESDYLFIGKFSRGHRLPYSKYDESYLAPVFQRKKNNTAAIVVCLDALEAYLSDSDATVKSENINMLYDEMANFCIYGLFGIGFFGVSVEDGFPVRVDSCGENVTRQYRSVYKNMDPEEYEKLDRVDSMTLDQQEERKFRLYILKYKHALAATLNTIFEEEAFARKSKSEVVRACLDLDQMFCTVCAKIGRADINTTTANAVWSAQLALDDLKMLMAPHRSLLKKDEIAVIADYTVADLKPVSKSAALYRASESPSGEMPKLVP